MSASLETYEIRPSPSRLDDIPYSWHCRENDVPESCGHLVHDPPNTCEVFPTIIIIISAIRQLRMNPPFSLDMTTLFIDNTYEDTHCVDGSINYCSGAEGSGTPAVLPSLCFVPNEMV